MKFLELKNHLMERKLLPCYLLIGDDSFVIKKAEQMFISLCGGFSQLNFTRFNSNAPLSEVVSALNSMPMLADFRVVIVEDYTAKLDEIKKYLENPSPTSVLVFVGSLTANFSPIAKQIETVDCARLDANYLMNWAGGKVTKAGCPTTKDAMTKLVNYCNRDMNRLNAETDKLIAYAGQTVITEDIVDKLVAPDLEFKVFELSDAIASKNAEKAITLAHKMLEDNGAHGKVFGLIYNHFRRLLHISLNLDYDGLTTDLKVHEFVIKNAKRQVTKFSVKRLKAIVDKLDDIDLILKSNSSCAKTVLIAFVSETVLVG